jgi:hypothetical protein
MDKSESELDIPNLRSLINQIDSLKDHMCTQVNGSEIQLARYDGRQGKAQFYLRHKDAFLVDPNNLN